MLSRLACTWQPWLDGMHAMHAASAEAVSAQRMCTSGVTKMKQLREYCCGVIRRATCGHQWPL